jgi:hypothetical protein
MMVLGLALIIRCDSLPINWQRVSVIFLLSVAGLLGAIYFVIRRERPTHHQYWSQRGSSRHEDIGHGEQKCGQLAIIFTITAWVIYLDMWLNWLGLLADKIGWPKFLSEYLG